jgi:hypothetical protein
MLSPHTHVAMKYIGDEETARRAARRPDALPDPVPEAQPAEAATTSRVRRRLARLHLMPARNG